MIDAVVACSITIPLPLFPHEKGWEHQVSTFPYFLAAKSDHMIQFCLMRFKIKSAELGWVVLLEKIDGEIPKVGVLSFPLCFGICYVSSQSGPEAAILWPWGYKPEDWNTCWGRSKPLTYSFLCVCEKWNEFIVNPLLIRDSVTNTQKQLKWFSEETILLVTGFVK